MKKSWQLLLSVLLILIIIGGCGKMDKKEVRTEEDWKKEAAKFDNGKPEADYTGEKEMFGEGYVNEDEARNNGYVPVQEFKDDEKSIIRNKKAQEVIDKDRKKIVEVAEKYLSKVYDRKIKVTQLQAIYPYDAINVVYESEDEPVLESDIVLYLNYNEEYEEADFKDISDNIIKENTVDGILKYVYNEETKKLGQYILKKNPEYFDNFKGKLKANRSPNIYVYIQSTYEKGYLDEKNEIIYRKYLEKPHTTKEEWIELFHNENLNYDISISVILKDKQNLPTETKLEKLVKDIKNYPKRLSGVYSISLDSSWMWSKDGTPMLTVDSNEQKWYLEGENNE